MRRLISQRAPVWLTAVALLMALQGCTTETLSPTSDTTPSASSAPSPSTNDAPTTSASTATPVESSTSASESDVVTVPPEASALPLPVDDTQVDALNPQEQADRAAIEAVWRKVWDLVARINEIAPTQRAELVEALMTDPIRAQLLQSAATADTSGLTTYGSITLYPYWYRAVDGMSYAVIGDCRDASRFGSIDRNSGEKKSVGTKDNNTIGKFVKTADGSWKLFDVVYVQDVPCSVG